MFNGQADTMATTTVGRKQKQIANLINFTMRPGTHFGLGHFTRSPLN